jgi:GWxTD domain-containing protein
MTRGRREGTRWSLACAVVLALLSAGAANGEDDFPLWSTGDIEFCIDVVCLRGGDSLAEVQVNCSVGNDQIRFVEEKSGEGQGSLTMRTVFRDASGQVIDEAERTVHVAARSMLQAQKRDVIQVVQLERRLPPGRHAMFVELEDAHAQKLGIWYALRGSKKKGAVEATVEVPDFSVPALGVSGLALARSIRPDSVGGEFSRSGLEIIPNPSHIYGLRLAELPVYFEIYDGRPMGDSLLVEYLVRDVHGSRVLGETRALGPEPRGLWPRAFAIPLVGIRQGSYELSVEVQDPETLEKASSNGHFEVMWSMLSWDRSIQEGLEELSLILTDDEMEEVGRMSPGEREQYMREYWKKLDPTPDTVQNEGLQEYYRRVKFAEEHYQSYQRGIYSDQGRIYIKYGPPDDSRQDAAWGGSPSAGDIANPGASQRTGSSGDRHVDETGMTFREMGMDETQREADRLGGVQSVGKTYEIWLYNTGGKPLSGKWAWKGSGKKIKFVFVDQRGYGDLDLIYSSEGEDY